VAVLQPRSCHRGDEELRAVGARAGVGHGQFIWFVKVEFRVELVFELIAWAADTATQWVTALDHEVWNDAVENGAVVESDTVFLFTRSRVVPFLGSGRQANEVVDGFWRMIAEEFDDDVAAVGLDNCFMCSDTHEGYSSIICVSLTVLSQRESGLLRPWPNNIKRMALKSWQELARP